METIVRTISDLSYDIIGFLLPGLALSVAISLAVAIICTGKTDPSSIRDFYLLLDWLARAPIAIVLIAVFSVSYLLGAMANYLAERGAWHFSAQKPSPLTEIQDLPAPKNTLQNWGRHPVCRVILLRRLAARPASFWKSLESTFVATASRLAAHLGYTVNEKDRWLQFSPIARTMARRGSRQSLVQSYQNKYTLARSMAYVVAVCFWLYILVTGFVVALHGQPMPFVAVVFALVISLCLIRALLLQFEMHWAAWGSIVIVESALILSELESATSSIDLEDAVKK